MTNQFGMGWVDDREAVAAVCATLPHPTFAEAAPHLIGTGMGQDAAFWEAEEKVLGKVLPSWNQGQIGTCVSFGFGRACQDLMLIRIAMGKAEEWPGAEVATEPIYAGSRVEVGGGRLGAGDGSVGAWAADYLKKWGILLRKVYGRYDLTQYSESVSRAWGRTGVPDDLEPEARKHPVHAITQIKTPEQAVDALANGYPIGICGTTSRTTKRSPGGWCRKTGEEWGHCEELRGTLFVQGGPNSPWGGDGAAPYGGNVQALVEQNSWGDYIGSANADVLLASGRTVTLPMGAYLSTLDERRRDLQSGDSFALNDAKLWVAQKLNWLI